MIAPGTVRGSCHCGTVRFEASVRAPSPVYECNCSICRRAGYLHLFVPRTDFTLLQGADNLETYTFNTGVAQHSFCRTCGVKAFYVPRSDPDCYSLNVRCLKGIEVSELEIRPFDGRNWEASMQGREGGLAGS